LARFGEPVTISTIDGASPTAGRHLARSCPGRDWVPAGSAPI